MCDAVQDPAVHDLRDLADRIRYNVEPLGDLADRADAIADRLEVDDGAATGT